MIPKCVYVGLLAATVACSSSTSSEAPDSDEDNSQNGCLRPRNRVVVADVHGDGKPDLIVVTDAIQDDNLVVVPGNGDGTFGTPVSVMSGRDLQAMGAVDVNGDRNVDLVIAGPGVNLLLGNGDGTFQPKPDSNILWGDGMVDANNDGVLDTVDVFNGFVMNGNEAIGVSTLAGNGDGTFRAGTISEVPAPNRNLWGVLGTSAMADINGDGNVDILLTDEHHDGTGSGVDLIFGNGDGTFNLQIHSAYAGPRPFRLTVADVNGDGKLDIITSQLTGTFRVLLAEGSGTFRGPNTYPFDDSAWLAVADVSSDGWPDLVVIGPRMIRVLLGRGDGTFEDQIDHAFTPPNGSNYRAAPVLIDVTNDGNPDLIVPITDEDFPTKIGLFLGNGDGTFQDMQCVHSK